MLRSLNPYTLEVIGIHEPDNAKVVEQKIELSEKAFFSWKKKTLDKRKDLVRSIAEQLLLKKEELALLMACEMGKPIAQGRAEIEKCADACHYFISHIDAFLADKTIHRPDGIGVVRIEPLGPWLAIMPWNFPFWQVIRCAIPGLLLGNSILLKHASNVTGCAMALETLIREAGAVKGLFQVLKISSSIVSDVIAHPSVKGVSLTGSEPAGRQVGAAAGRNIKPCILELGGSNAFIVCEDANLEEAVKHAVLGRFNNSGQSCISAKRIILAASIADEFTERFIAEIKSFKLGNPLDDDTFIGPLARPDLAEEIHRLVQQSVAQGAKCMIGGSYAGALYAPTLLTHCALEMPVMKEETFGPVACISVFQSWDEAIRLSNSTKFGLGVSIFTSKKEWALNESRHFEEGAVFINQFVKSDPALPFGGVKTSGLGRELSIEGILQMSNIKTLFIK